MLHSARHGQYQGKLVLNSIPLISSCTSLCYTHMHTHSHTHKKLDTQAREQITVGLQQWAILTHQKGRRKQKKGVWKYLSLSLIRREKWLPGQSSAGCVSST
ncbi:hypothetical protein EXN66_Car000935 [Channa argus]|uniref:Uncharacterized protein n=1 Tax=Channa argus TaxID=215402 RepID=A0A6G1QYQ1_CHAAH|nr:hypothetical protein EXN66_Car000935 [Channa argus]